MMNKRLNNWQSYRSFKAPDIVFAVTRNKIISVAAPIGAESSKVESLYSNVCSTKISL